MATSTIIRSTYDREDQQILLVPTTVKSSVRHYRFLRTTALHIMSMWIKKKQKPCRLKQGLFSRVASSDIF